MATKGKNEELSDESGSESLGSDSASDSSDMELTESDGEDDIAIDVAMSDEEEGEDEVNTQKKAPVKEAKKKKKVAKEAKKKKVTKKVTKKKANKKKKAVVVENIKKTVKNGKSLKDDVVVNAEKNKLDVCEDSIKKPPFEEVGDIVDMNKDASSNIDLCKKIYRITPKGSAMQYTIRADHRSTVTKTNGEKYGIYPTLIQSKFRVDEKRPMGKDGKEKAPWTMDCDLKELPTILKVLKKIQNNNSGYFDWPAHPTAHPPHLKKNCWSSIKKNPKKKKKHKKEESFVYNFIYPYLPTTCQILWIVNFKF